MAISAALLNDGATPQGGRRHVEIEGCAYDVTTGPPEGWSDAIFSCSTFRRLEFEGAGIDGALIHCALEGVDWYWGHFNAALVARTDFTD